MTTATTRTRRKLTIENSHDLHRNPYMSTPHRNPLLAIEWAHVHYLTCPKCRRRVDRMNRPEAIQRQIEKRMAREVG